MRPNEWGTPVVGRRSFTLRQFWLWASCFMPEHYFIVGRSQPVLSRMPVSFRYLMDFIHVLAVLDMSAACFTTDTSLRCIADDAILQCMGLFMC